MDRIEERIRTLQNGLKIIKPEEHPELHKELEKELQELLNIKNREVTRHV